LTPDVEAWQTVSMTTEKSTAKSTPAAAAEAEFEKRRKQFGGDVKVARMFAREEYDRVAGRR
jgi:hypothetical protein